jgi:hypothetical protein
MLLNRSAGVARPEISKQEPRASFQDDATESLDRPEILKREPRAAAAFLATRVWRNWKIRVEDRRQRTVKNSIKEKYVLFSIGIGG